MSSKTITEPPLGEEPLLGEDKYTTDTWPECRNCIYGKKRELNSYLCSRDSKEHIYWYVCEYYKGKYARV